MNASLLFTPLSPFVVAAAWLVLVLAARVLRSQLFAAFVGVVIGVLSLIWVGLAPSLPTWVLPAFLVGQIQVWLHYGLLSRARPRPAWFRFGISVPALFFAAATLLAAPWAVAATVLRWSAENPPWSGFAAVVPGWWIPFVIAALGTVQSFFARRETVILDPAPSSSVPDESAVEARTEEVTRPTFERVERRRGLGAPLQSGQDPRRGGLAAGGSLRIGVLSDPHLGPFVSPRRLADACRRLVDAEPDLICLPGDLLTMESQQATEWVSPALEPLGQLEGRVFACLGNHDLEDLESVHAVYARHGIRLLVDEAQLWSDGDRDPIEIVGLAHRWGRRNQEHGEVLDALGPPEHPRIVLLHDPTAFAHLPAGSAPLVLSGHTHGGQVGLLSLGLEWTTLRWIAPAIPDHGAWRRGPDLLYVHRGLGHYGFPIRLGVPAEESVLEWRTR